MLAPLTIAFFSSLITALMLIRYLHLHQHLSCDPSQLGPQKFHLGLTPRIGGIPILFGCATGMVMGWWNDFFAFDFALSWFMASAPIFCAGILEDVTKRISPRYRLLASFASAAIGAWLLGAVIPRLALFGIDHLLYVFPLFALLVTIVAVGGICHSLNLIDGYNGLAGGVACIILGALAYVCFIIGDVELLFVCVVTISATIGFLAWNYPRGLIFAGDGGAYLLGFIIAEISVLLVVKHQQVSPWFPLTLVMYPVWETVFTIYRRKFVQGQATGLPDALHLHQMVFNRLVRWMVGKREIVNLRRRNALTTPYLWGMVLMTVMPATLFWQKTAALQIVCSIFVIFYIWLYQRIVNFRAPKWLMVHSSPKKSDTER